MGDLLDACGTRHVRAYYQTVPVSMRAVEPPVGGSVGHYVFCFLGARLGGREDARQSFGKLRDARGTWYTAISSVPSKTAPVSVSLEFGRSVGNS